MSDRGRGTHIRADGTAKESFPSREAALTKAQSYMFREYASRPLYPYLCNQRPEHWHLTGRVPDLVGPHA